MADDAGNNIYVQDSGRDAIRLTDTGRDRNPVLSDDGREIAFFRGLKQLCVIHVDGSGERVLVSQEMLAAFGEVYKSEFLELYKMAFVPGTHQLLFSTWLYRRGGEGHGQRNDDLWLVDADRGKLRQLRAPGQSGIFLAAPNGKWIAVETVDHIDVIDIQGQFIHHNLVTNFPAMDDYYGITWASMSWTPSSSELIVLSTYIPPATGITVVRTAWRYPLHGGPGLEIKLDPPPVYDAYAVSPDGNWIVYSCGPEAPVDNSEAIAGIYLGNLHDGTSRLIYTPTVDEAGNREVPYDYDEWSPDSVHFVFREGLRYRMFLGNIHGETVPLSYGVGILGWIDNNHYLFEGGEVIGEVGKQERVNVMGSFPYYEISGSDVKVSFVVLEH